MTRTFSHYEVGTKHRDHMGEYCCRFVKRPGGGTPFTSLNQGYRYRTLEFPTLGEAETFAAKYPNAEVLPVYLETYA